MQLVKVMPVVPETMAPPPRWPDVLPVMKHLSKVAVPPETCMPPPVEPVEILSLIVDSETVREEMPFR
ncbi:MAG: hypothetical protein A2511_02605 [Deltaproteobacteria bacterium RIFOXYD12_FULL_50_9]|nr:MAG: hypothetical protein A2511_02605 [Deltaproteobacteria bacterium RIFOXYD12_FULL_50_9]